MLEEAERRLEELKETVWRKVAEELRFEDDYQFIRAYSPGLQEWVEALSFYHFLRHEKIISHQDTADQLRFSSADTDSPVYLRVTVPQSEYVLGLADLTGELMRNAINALGSGDLEVGLGWPGLIPQLIKVFSPSFRSEGGGTLTRTFSGLFHSVGDPPIYGRGFRSIPQAGRSRQALACWNMTDLLFQETPREIGQKLYTLKQSCRKVENACYAIAVRGSEIPKNRWADLFSKKEEERVQEDFFN